MYTCFNIIEDLFKFFIHVEIFKDISSNFIGYIVVIEYCKHVIKIFEIIFINFLSN